LGRFRRGRRVNRKTTGEELVGDFAFAVRRSSAISRRTEGRQALSTILKTCRENWGVVVVEAQRHRLATASLAANGFEYFLPIEETSKVEHGRYIKKRKPLLGPYLFVLLAEQWRWILGLRGVAGMILTPDLEPAVVDTNQLSQFGFDERKRTHRSVVTTGIQVGQSVRPRSGPFVYMTGTYDGLVNNNREAALFRIFGVDTRVVFAKGELVIAD